MLKKAFLLFLTETQSFSPNQYIFPPNRSCFFNLLLREERVTCLMNEGHRVDLVYFDFTMAFDSYSLVSVSQTEIPRYRWKCANLG